MAVIRTGIAQPLGVDAGFSAAAAGGRWWKGVMSGVGVGTTIHRLARSAVADKTEFDFVGVTVEHGGGYKNFRNCSGVRPACLMMEWSVPVLRSLLW